MFIKNCLHRVQTPSQRRKNDEYCRHQLRSHSSFLEWHYLRMRPPQVTKNKREIGSNDSCNNYGEPHRFPDNSRGKPDESQLAQPLTNDKKIRSGNSQTREYAPERFSFSQNHFSCKNFRNAS